MTLSYWERESLSSYDVIIIGAGIVGMSAAAAVKEQDPHLQVLVLERGTLPSGASTKNAGFACFGSVTELIDDLSSTSETEVLDILNMRWKGLQAFKSRISDDTLINTTGGFELIRETESYALDEVGRLNTLLRPIFNDDVFEIVDHRIADFGFSSSSVKHMILNKFEGQINTGNAIDQLWTYCGKLGVRFLFGTEVNAISGKEVQTTNMSFFAERILICTNAFTQQLLPNIDMQPGRGQVLITQPLKGGTRFTGVFHMDKGYYYFRNVDNRVLIGGARNAAFGEETTTSFGNTDLIEEKLLELLHTDIIPDTDFELDMKWSGIMSFGPNKRPIVEKHSEHLYIGVRLGGMGVAIGSLVGQQVAELALQN